MSISSIAALPRPAASRALRAALLCLGAATSGLASRSAAAQPVLGIGENAVVLPRGVLRVSLGGELDLFDRRYSNDPTGEPTGTLAPFRGELAGPLGAGAVGLVGQLEERLRGVTGATGLTLSLGGLDPRADARRISVPIRLELGVGSRLQLSAMVPYVQTRVVAFPVATGSANVGLNPALEDPALAARTTTLLGQFASASEQLASALAGCAADPASSPACGDPEQARATNLEAQAFAAAIGELYVSSEGGALLVPVSGSDAAAAVAARIAAYREAYAALGITAIEAGGGPANAAPPTADDFQQLATDPAFGFGYAPIRSRSRYGIGDVELGARLLLVDGFGADAAQAVTGAGRVRYRATATALVRLATGATDDPDDLLDIGIGDGQHDVELGMVGDVAIGRVFVSAAARYGLQLAGDMDVRVAGDQLLIPAESRMRVSRDPGDYLELEVTPRYAFGELISIGAQYRYRGKGADSFDGLADDGAASVLERASEAYEHRVGAGVTLSTLSAWARGRVGAPLEVSYLHSRTVSGGGALTNRSRRDEVVLRLYLGLFGSRR